MLIGNVWVENTHLKFLNDASNIAAGWLETTNYVETGTDERGIIVGLSASYLNALDGWGNMQITLNGEVSHQGYFRFTSQALGNVNVRQRSYQQPAQMPMPQIDVPPDTVVRVRFQAGNAGIVNDYVLIDLAMITYRIAEYEEAVKACFPTDVSMPSAV